MITTLGKKYFMSCGTEDFSNNNYFEISCNTVCIYFKNENGGKTCLSIFKGENDSFKHEVYLFRELNDNHFYRSYCYESSKLPKKYKTFLNILIEKYNSIF